MEIQNLLVGAVTHLIQFQSTKCPKARERALMMFETLANLKNSNTEIQTLCHEATELLAN
jgi:hypothetical protein